MPRGGRRKGTPGTAYQNRSDLQAPQTQPVTTVPGQGYGVAGQQQKAQQTAPLAGAGAGAPPPAKPQQPPQGFGRPMPQPLDAPTQRPKEPLTSGAPLGPGPGPEALPQIGPPPDDLGLFLKELYRAQPSTDVLRLLTEHDSRQPSTPAQMGPPQQGALPPQMGPPPVGQVGASPPAPQVPPPPEMPNAFPS